MTTQPQLSTSGAPADLAGAADAADAHLLAPAGTTTALLEPPLAPPEPVRSGLWQFLGSPSVKPLVLGLSGCLVLVLGSLGAGGTLRHDPLLSGTPLVALRFGHGYTIAVVLSYVGLAALYWAWVQLGRDVLARRAGGRAVLSTAVVWMLPMVIAAPLFSRDPYSYLAYGTLPLHGYDPYTYGPNVLSGPIQQNVHWFWQDTPAPYGPLFVAVAKAVAWVTGSNMVAGVIVMRLVLMLGVVMLVAALPGLVRHLGGRVSTALWLAVANPVMVVLLVGGPHNDLLVLGFLASGTLLVLNRRHAAGIALVTLAAAVKATAALALPFLVLVWAARMTTGSQRSRITRAIAGGVTVFVAVFIVCSLVADVGAGWLIAVNAPSSIVSWLSLPTGVGQMLYSVANWMFNGLPQTPFISVTRVIAVALFLLITVKQWLAARAGGPDGVDAIRRAGVVLLLFPLLSPATLPWYFTWGMAVLAAVAWTARGMAITIFMSVFLIVASFPDGEVALYAFGYVILVMAGAVLASVSLTKPDPLGLRERRRNRRRIPAAATDG
jgi:alpha-1,6-mannosyltransferase